jgi:mannosyltransferase
VSILIAEKTPVGHPSDSPNMLIRRVISWTHLELAGVLSITVLAGVLRFYHLGAWSFWRDEVYTVLHSIQPTLQGSKPVWYLITHLSISSLGISEWSARLPSAITGTLAIPVTYLLLRRICGSQAAMIAALLIAVSPWHLYWSQNARFYILVSLLTSMAILIFYRALEENRLPYLLGSILLFGLAVISHETALLSAAAVAAYVLLLAWLKPLRPAGFTLRNLGIPVAAASLFILLFVVRLILKLPAWEQINWQEINPFWLGPEQSALINNNPIWLGSVVAYYIGVPILCMAVFGSAYLVWRRDRLAILLSLATIIPVAAIMLASLFYYSASRYMFAAAIPCIILAGQAAGALIRQLPTNAKWLGFAVVALLAIGPLSEDVLYYRYQNGNRFDYRGAYQIVQQHLQPGDLVLCDAPELGDYYLKTKIAQPIASVDLTRLSAEQRRAWFVIDVQPTDLNSPVRLWLASNTVLIANLDVHASARTFVSRVHLFDPSCKPCLQETAGE